ncbi:MAG: tail fiber domain-containing protein [Deltaproteobacteria bacterium]|nr:tail fiber domain-containing protein [Deltaproteobacteria bacterium]
MDTNTGAVRKVVGLPAQAHGHRVWQSAVVVAGLVFTLNGPASWGGPPNPTDSDAGDNTAGGTNALVNTVPNLLDNTGLRNTAFGAEALTSNTAGTNNSALGTFALQGNTEGGDNTGIGAFALHSNTKGSSNTGIGQSALFSNTVGTSNSALGAFALQSNTQGTGNTAFGTFTLNSSTGNNNTGIGSDVLLNNTTGHSNTALGAGALHNITTSSNNIALGSEAGVALTSGNKNIYLGHRGRASESKTMRLGSGQTRTFISGIEGTPLSGSMVLIDSKGQLGVPVSSARYKQAIHGMGERSRGVLKLRPVTFRYKQDASARRQYGLIAEEVVKVYPELVTRGADGQVESVQYHELIPMLLNELQYQQQQLTTQSQQVAELRAQNARLQEALVQQSAALAERLERLEAEAAQAAPTLVSR